MDLGSTRAWIAEILENTVPRPLDWFPSTLASFSIRCSGDIGAHVDSIRSALRRRGSCYQPQPECVRLLLDEWWVDNCRHDVDQTLV